ncbi:MAG: hypothetical protein JW797_07430 [Bradymonadales bacterium]|nr:hypothetical protein [Bradymonadales bacterium]
MIPSSIMKCLACIGLVPLFSLLFPALALALAPTEPPASPHGRELAQMPEGSAVVPLPTDTPTSPMEPATPEAMDWQAIPDRIKALQAEIEWNQEQARDGLGFDPNRYFEILTHIAMEPGWVLDWVYLCDGMYGQPILYARPETMPRFQSFEEYVYKIASREAAQELLDRLVYVVSEWGYTERMTLLTVATFNTMWDWRNHLVVDGSDVGYFEILVLQLLEEQFNRHGVSNQVDTVLVCSPEKVEEVIQGRHGVDQTPLPQYVASAARASFSPVRIERQGDQVTIDLELFRAGGGFVQMTAILPLSDPFTKVTTSYEWLAACHYHTNRLE